MNMTNSSHQCPPGTTLRTDLPISKRLCGIGISDTGCSLTAFDTHGISIQSSLWEDYWISGPDPGRIWSRTVSANRWSLCWRHQSYSWQKSSQAHLDICSSPPWKLIGNVHPAFLCPCTDRIVAASATPPPCFVGNDYFCDTGSTEQAHGIFYGDDPLRDGADCGPLNDCCDLNSPP